MPREAPPEAPQGSFLTRLFVIFWICSDCFPYLGSLIGSIGPLGTRNTANGEQGYHQQEYAATCRRVHGTSHSKTDGRRYKNEPRRTTQRPHTRQGPDLRPPANLGKCCYGHHVTTTTSIIATATTIIFLSQIL